MEENTAKTLVCKYNFLPETSGIVTAKRIYENKEKVDIIYNKPIKPVDEDLKNIISEYIEDEIVVSDGGHYFDYKKNRSQRFLKESLEEISKLTAKKGEYEKVYSRVSFPISNFIAFEYKLKKS